jgi:hypothetical protein
MRPRHKGLVCSCDNHVAWLQVPSVVSALSALEFMAMVCDNRTGMLRNNQGLEDRQPKQAPSQLCEVSKNKFRKKRYR